MQRPALHSAIVALAGAFSAPVALAVNIDLVTVGDPGNAGTLSGAGAGGYGPDRVCGAVGYTYNIGKYEVTAGQYTEFLNAVAKTDTYGLYNAYMVTSDYGCGIRQDGSPGSYTYRVDPLCVNRPVRWLSYWNACRFTNWLNNDQPTGTQGPSTTERGTYTLDGYNDRDGRTIQRNPGAKWAIANEDEWYKAAYYKGGSTNAGYWNYATCSDTMPGRDLTDSSGNNANSYGSPYPIEPPFVTTMVGQFRNSPSPYGTFDQGGNLEEWTETVVREDSTTGARGTLGGSFYQYWSDLRASARYSSFPTWIAAGCVGFRVVYLPEPSTLALLTLGGLAVMRGRRCSGHF